MNEQKEEEKDDTCPACRQDNMFLVGSGMYWLCGTCGHHKKPEREEP